jgi:hypothetical protein
VDFSTLLLLREKDRNETEEKVMENSLNEFARSVVGKRAVDISPSSSGELSHHFKELNSIIAELGGIMGNISDLVFIPRPQDPTSEGRGELGKVTTVSQRLVDVYGQLYALRVLATDVRDALSSQLDSETRLA